MVFAICSGGVNYTRRFYHEIVTQGANGASPLLFPETVYNAAASHLAALLGLNGQSYTLVGDSSVGLGGGSFRHGTIDHCNRDWIIVWWWVLRKRTGYWPTHLRAGGWRQIWISSKCTADPTEQFLGKALPRS